MGLTYNLGRVSPSVFTDSSLNVGIGAAPSGTYKLDVTGTGRFTGALTLGGGTGGINFTSSTTITNTASSGYTAIYANGGGVYLGGSASVNHLSIASTGAATFSSGVTSGPTVNVDGRTNNTSGDNALTARLGSNCNNTSSYLFVGETGGVNKCFIWGSGAIASTSTSITNITSDVNLKTDIKDYDKGLAEVLAMKPRYYKYKDNLEEQKVGFIAQEMEEAIAGTMIDSYLKNEETGENYKTFQLEWYPILVKAIQEQQATITSLQDRITKAGL